MLLKMHLSLSKQGHSISKPMIETVNEALID